MTVFGGIGGLILLIFVISFFILPADSKSILSILPADGKSILGILPADSKFI